MKRTKYALCLLLLIFAFKGQAQEIRNLNNYPYAVGFINPAYVGDAGLVELDLNFRKQWYGIEGSPKIGSLLLQVPVGDKLGLGVDLGTDSRGLLNTFHGQGIFSYAVGLGANSKLGFGLTFGVSKTDIDFEQVSDPNDPALGNVMDNSFSLEGKFGFFLRARNLDIGFTLPKLFRPNYNTTGFGEITLEPLNYTQSFIKTTIQVNENFRLEPWLNVRTFDNLKADYEVLVLAHVKQALSFGASYRIDSGPTFYLGININSKTRASYSYELANNQVPGLSQGTHEFQLSLLLGDNVRTDTQEEVEEEEEPVEEVVEEPVEEIREEPVEEVVEEKQPIAEEKPEVKPDTVKTQPQPIEEEPVQEEVVEIVEEPEVPVDDEEVDFKPGHYLVIGVFNIESNANGYRDRVSGAGYSPFIIQGNDTAKYYVILEQSDDLEALRRRRGTIRQINQFNFGNAWILSID